jgi:hypothetical protein
VAISPKKVQLVTNALPWAKMPPPEAKPPFGPFLPFPVAFKPAVSLFPAVAVFEEKVQLATTTIEVL